MSEQAVNIGEWNLARCPKGIRPTCAVCHGAIGAGSRIMVKPFAEVRHERCHTALLSTLAARPERTVYR